MRCTPEEKAALVGLGVQHIADFAAALERAKIPNLSVQYHVYDGETHESVRLRSFPAGLNWVYQGKK